MIPNCSLFVLFVDLLDLLVWFLVTGPTCIYMELAGSNGTRLAISLPIELSLGTIWLSLVNVYGELTAQSSMVDGAWVRTQFTTSSRS